MNHIKYNIELEVITPLSVGAGNENEWLRGADYLVENDRVYILDMDKMARLNINIDKYASLLREKDIKEKGKRDFLPNDLHEISAYEFDLPCDSKNPIKTFIRSQLHDNPVIPGSSIKGSLRSILYKHLPNDRRYIITEFKKDSDNIMRYLQVGDVEISVPTVLYNTKVFNLQNNNNHTYWQGGWKDRGRTLKEYNDAEFNTLYECLQPGTKGQGSLVFPNEEKFFELLRIRNIHELLRIVNTHTSAFLDKERHFFETYDQAEGSGEILENIEDLLKQIPQNDNSCIFRMSAGSGFHSITGDWKYNVYTLDGVRSWTKAEAEKRLCKKKDVGAHKYKSRKVIDCDGQLQLMGFVKLRILPEKEATK